MTERDDTNLELVGRRIRGLSAKTVENGCTEEEAILAATKARELMDRYRLTLTDVQVQEEPVDYVIIDRPGHETRLAAVDFCVKGIARYCGVKMWFTERSIEGKKLRLIAVLGLRGDVEMARYLYEMLASAIKSESSRLKGASRSSFQVGMAYRINERLTQMAIDLEPTAKTGSGTALVVVKGALVDDAYAKLNLRLRSISGGPRNTDHAAYSAGRAAGDRVNLNRPVGSRAADKMLR
jgi:hypothetical protein